MYCIMMQWEESVISSNCCISICQKVKMILPKITVTSYSSLVQQTCAGNFDLLHAFFLESYESSACNRSTILFGNLPMFFDTTNSCIKKCEV